MVHQVERRNNTLEEEGADPKLRSPRFEQSRSTVPSEDEEKVLECKLKDSLDVVAKYGVVVPFDVLDGSEGILKCALAVTFKMCHVMPAGWT